MEDKSKVIFGNVISKKDYKKACKTKAKNLKKFGDDSNVDYNIVIAQDMGRPFEEHEIRKKLKKLCEDASLPVVVPHAMRHLSVTLKLLISGDVKAVQADSGHKDAGMVLNRYSHAVDAERKKWRWSSTGCCTVPVRRDRKSVPK